MKLAFWHRDTTAIDRLAKECAAIRAKRNVRVIGTSHGEMLTNKASFTFKVR